MAIKIENIFSSNGSTHVCLVRHGELEFTVNVNFHGKLTKKSEYFFEMGYEAIQDLKKIQTYDDNMSGIFPTNSENELCIVGKVSGIFKEDNIELLDLYIQKGPEFVTIDKNEVPNCDYEVGDGVKIVVRNMTMYVHGVKEEYQTVGLNSET